MDKWTELVAEELHDIEEIDLENNFETIYQSLLDRGVGIAPHEVDALYNEVERQIHAQYRADAIAAGIPASVVDGKTKLSDHFSESYINHMCNRENVSDED